MFCFYLPFSRKGVEDDGRLEEEGKLGKLRDGFLDWDLERWVFIKTMRRGRGMESWKKKRRMEA